VAQINAAARREGALMTRQRLHLDSSPIATAVGRGLVALLGAAIAWYGLMVVLLAFKVSPSTVDDISGYRTAFDYLTGLEAGDLSSSDRLIIAIVAVVVALLAALLLWLALPRPRLARHPIEVERTDLGRTEVAPRAVERAVESAALRHPDILGARARYDDDRIELAVTARRATSLVETLRAVEESAFESLATHQLGPDHVDVTLAGYDSPKGRELQ
jgi:hypothetical protein